MYSEIVMQTRERVCFNTNNRQKKYKLMYCVNITTQVYGTTVNLFLNSEKIV